MGFKIPRSCAFTVYVLFIASFVFDCDGFLLQNTSSGTEMADQHYIYVMGLLGQEKANVQQMEKIILKLNSEMKSLQQQVSGSNPSNLFSQEMSNVINKTSMLTDSMANVQYENSVLKKELGQVKQDFKQLQNDYSALNKRNEMLQSAMYVYNNATIKLKTELETFTHSIPAGNLNNITEVQSNVESLEHKLDKTTTQLNVLISSSNARGQDFLALLNQTRNTQHKITTLEVETNRNLQSYQTSSNQKITDLEMKTNKSLQSYQSMTDQKITNLETKTNTSLQSYQSSTNQKISDISHSRNSINRKVALTSCGGKSVSGGSVINLFTITKNVNGISDVSAFKSSGKFRCEFPGVYLFSVFIMSNTNPSIYEIYKNYAWITSVHVVSGGTNSHSDHTGTGIVAVSLDVGDTLYVKAFRSMHVDSGSSCVTVIKIG